MEESEKKRDVIILLLDGCRADALKKAEAPNLARLASEGIYAENATTVYPSLTAVGHASILTGAYPEKTGVTNHFYWDKEERKLVNLFSDEHIEVPTIFDVLAKNGMKGVSIGAHMRKGSRDPLTRRVARKTAGYIASTLIMNTISKNPSLYRLLRKYAVGQFSEFKRAYEGGEHALYYLCFNETDKAGHRYGPESDRYYEAIEQCDKKLEEILSLREKLKRDTTIIVTSDHGQTTLEERLPLETLHFDQVEYRIDDVKELAGSVVITYNRGKENTATATVVSRHVQIWLHDERDAEKLVKALNSKKGVTFVKTREETKPIGLCHPRLGDVTFCLEDGYGFDFLPLAESGDHGGVSEAEMNVPIILWEENLSNRATEVASVTNIAPITIDIVNAESRLGGLTYTSQINQLGL